MPDVNKGDSMKAKLLIPLLALVILTVLLVAGNASAGASSLQPCSLAHHNAGTGSRYWHVGLGSITGTDYVSCFSGGGEYEIGVITHDTPTYIWCKADGQGIVPPAANIVTIRMVADNTGFGTTNPSAIRTYDVSSTCTSGTSTNVGSFYCTSDGTVSGAPRYGPVRIHVYAQRTDVGTYTAYSESSASDSAWGMIFCGTSLTNAGDKNTDEVYPYVGGDTISVWGQLEAAPYTSGATVRVNATCGGSTVNLGSFAITSTNSTLASGVIQGTGWATSCSKVELALSGALAKTTQVSGWSSVASYLYIKDYPTDWSSSSNGRGKLSLEFGTWAYHSIKRTSGQSMDRALTGTCSADDLTINRGMTTGISCTINNARGPIQSGRAMAAYTAKPPSASTADMTSGTPTSTAGGVTWTTTASQTAQVGNYGVFVETYGDVSRTSGVRFGWGSIADVVTVTNQIQFDGITISRSETTIANVSELVISVHNGYVRSEPLRDIRGTALVGVTVSCAQINPDGNGNTIINAPTDSNGRTPMTEFTAGTPAGIWQIDCIASWNGNSGQYVVSYRHVSPASAHASLGLIVEKVNETELNVTAIIREYSETCDCVAPVFPDAGSPVRVTLLRFNASNGLYDVIASRMVTNQTNPQESSYYVVANVAEGLDRPISVHVTANFSGLRWLGISSFGSYADQSSNITALEQNAAIYNHEVIPKDLGISSIIIVISLLGVAIGFVSKTNPFPTFIGLIVQLLAFAFWYSQDPGFFIYDGVDLNTAVGLMLALAFLGLAFRTFLMSQHSRQLFGEPE